MGIRSHFTRAAYRTVGKLLANRDSHEPGAKWYPTCFGKNFLYHPMFEAPDGEAYFAKYHAEKLENPLTPTFKRFKADILKGRRYGAGKWHAIKVGEPSALPYAITGVDMHRPAGNFTVKLKVCGRELNLGGLAAERFYYLPIREPGDIQFYADQELIIANAIPLQQARSHDVPMAMVIFVDNFGWDVLKRIDVSTELPNIHRFFSKGLTFDNCHSSSNWTLAGAGSIFSGLALSHHGMFHNARTDMFLGDGYQVLPEYFQKDGYLTFHSGGNSRMTPAYRYTQGFDRTVYRPDMPLCEVLDVLYDHLRAFPDRDHFIWLTIMDAHHTLAAVPDVANQLGAPLEAQDYRKDNLKSPMQKRFDTRAAARYVEELKRIDFALGSLFTLLESRYADDEMMVSLVADHGPGFLTEDNHSLSHEKTHVAWMLRGRGVPQSRTNELVHVTDILPTILTLNGYRSVNDIDGRLPAVLGGNDPRSFVLAEIKFPGQRYEAAIKDDAFEFYLKTHASVDDAGTVDLSAYETELFLIGNWSQDVSAEHPDVIRRYADYVIDVVTNAARRGNLTTS